MPRSSTILFFVLCFLAIEAFRLPEFLQNASNETKKEYMAIVKSKLSPDAMAKEIEKWISNQNSDIQKAYGKFKTDMETIKTRFGNSVANEIKSIKN
uniref:DUF148 domain-containing protein n=1 Tax=Panagrolaimus sp. JU765 TaxID=591449 RepID=A0AC34PX32_9BILA